MLLLATAGLIPMRVGPESVASAPILRGLSRIWRPLWNFAYSGNGDAQQPFPRAKHTGRLAVGGSGGSSLVSIHHDVPYTWTKASSDMIPLDCTVRSRSSASALLSRGSLVVGLQRTGGTCSPIPGVFHRDRLFHAIGTVSVHRGRRVMLSSRAGRERCEVPEPKYDTSTSEQNDSQIGTIGTRGKWEWDTSVLP